MHQLRRTRHRSAPQLEPGSQTSPGFMLDTMYGTKFVLRNVRRVCGKSGAVQMSASNFSLEALDSARHQHELARRPCREPYRPTALNALSHPALYAHPLRSTHTRRSRKLGRAEPGPSPTAPTARHRQAERTHSLGVVWFQDILPASPQNIAVSWKGSAPRSHLFFLSRERSLVPQLLVWDFDRRRTALSTCI